MCKYCNCDCENLTGYEDLEERYYDEDEPEDQDDHVKYYRMYLKMREAVVNSWVGQLLNVRPPKVSG